MFVGAAGSDQIPKVTTTKLSWNANVGTLGVESNISYISPSGTANITAYMLDSGSLSFEGNVGQLFSITNSLTGTLFSVNDISGIPSIEVLDTGTVRLAQYSGNVGIGTATPGYKLDVTGSAYISADVIVNGDLLVNGNTTTINTSTLIVEDKNITIANVVTPTNTTADGGGITLKGATDKTINWVNASGAWTSSEDLDLLTGKVYKINNTSVLSASALGSGVTSSSLTSVGTLSTLTVSGNVTIDTNTLFVDSVNNRVGVGTTSPSSSLHINGTLATDILKLTTTSGGNWSLRNYISGVSNDGFSLYDLSGNASRLVVTQTGNVGIGTTTTPSKLTINADPVGATANTLTTAATLWSSYASGTGNNAGSGTQLVFANGFGPADIVKSAAIGAPSEDTGGYSRSIGLSFWTSAFDANRSERMRISSVGNVGIGTTNPSYKLEVNGSFAATTKSFVIEHPTKTGYKLRYGSLEGPENGVYIRGRSYTNIIELPDYWTALVDPDTITVDLTPVGRYQKLYVEKIENNKVYVFSENMFNSSINCFYTIWGERKDVDRLQVEIKQ